MLDNPDQSILTFLRQDLRTMTTSLPVPHRMIHDLHLPSESTEAPQALECRQLDRCRALATPKAKDRHRL